MMNSMKTHQPYSATRSLLATAAIVFGLIVGSGQLAAASTQPEAGSDRAGIDSARVISPVQEATAITADDHPQVFAGADKARDGFGFPVGVKKVGRHVHDGYQKVDYDEVSEVAADGQPLALTQFDSSGRLTAAARFDLGTVSGARIGGDGAVKAAQRGLNASGLTVAGQARTDSSASDGGWDVHWDRVADGLAVRGDEVRVHLWSDGRIQTVGRAEHPLAAAPSQRLSQLEARTAATRQLSQWSVNSGAQFSVTGMEIQWVGPNAAFDATKLNDAAAPYRMAWVVNVKPTGSRADYVSLITLYVDAENGSVIGGDVVE